MTPLHWRFKAGGLALLVGLSLLTAPPVQTAKPRRSCSRRIDLKGGEASIST